ncbi:MAG: hypothetical protein U1G08_08955, partial [Verrucomicrobiota bacterium]
MNVVRWYLTVLLLAIGSGQGAWGVEITGVPVVVPGETSAVIRWVTDQECGSRVRFGLQPDRLEGRANGSVATHHVV